MAGEINGTKVLIKKDGSTIVGQMEATVTFNGTPIDISNKSQGDWVTLLDGELAGKQLQISGTLIYNSDTVYRQVRADALAGTQDTYTIEYTSDATTDEAFSATFVPNGLSDALPMGDKVTTSITLLSSGTVTHTAAA
jgi:predicted secreted protein